MPTLVRPAVMTCFCLLANAGAMAAAPVHEGWVGAWGFPPTSFTPAPAAPPVPAATQNRGPAPPADLNNVTVRQVVRIAAAADRIRIRFSNEFSDQPLRLGEIGRAHV